MVFLHDLFPITGNKATGFEENTEIRLENVSKKTAGTLYNEITLNTNIKLVNSVPFYVGSEIQVVCGLKFHEAW